MDWIEAKQIVSKTKNDQWFGTDFNMNLYRGCHHGCIYCDSRSTCYHLEDFDRVRGKKEALEKLKRELSGKRSTGVIGTGAMSDPYNRFEASEQLIRGALKGLKTLDLFILLLNQEIPLKDGKSSGVRRILGTLRVMFRIVLLLKLSYNFKSY